MAAAAAVAAVRLLAHPVESPRDIVVNTERAGKPPKKDAFHCCDESNLIIRYVLRRKRDGEQWDVRICISALQFYRDASFAGRYLYQRHARPLRLWLYVVMGNNAQEAIKMLNYLKRAVTIIKLRNPISARQAG
jgi:hypothetical protein